MPTLTTTTLGRFCRELAGGLDDIPILLEEWNLTPLDFEDIQKSPAFTNEMQVVRQEMADLGNDAGYIYRMKSLSEQLLPDFVALITNKDTSPMLKFEMMKWAAEMARLKEKPSVKSDPQAGPRGPMVVFKFGAGLPIQSMVVHAGEVEPVPVDNVVDNETQKERLQALPIRDVDFASTVDESGWPV